MLNSHNVTSVDDPPIARALFNDVRWSWIWLIVRLYVGWEWLKEGLDKVTSPVWAGAKAGTALAGWLTAALTKTAGPHPDVQGWYAIFLKDVVLPHAPFWSVLVSYGELLVGLGLVLGFFTGIAAFFGTMMNTSYLLGGTVSINPILLGLGSLLVLAWKTAGWWGLDRFMLPRLGTPWRSSTREETS